MVSRANTRWFEQYRDLNTASSLYLHLNNHIKEIQLLATYSGHAMIWVGLGVSCISKSKPIASNPIIHLNQTHPITVKRLSINL